MGIGLKLDRFGVKQNDSRGNSVIGMVKSGDDFGVYYLSSHRKIVPVHKTTQDTKFKTPQQWSQYLRKTIMKKKYNFNYTKAYKRLNILVSGPNYMQKNNVKTIVQFNIEDATISTFFTQPLPHLLSHPTSPMVKVRLKGTLLPIKDLTTLPEYSNRFVLSPVSVVTTCDRFTV